MGGWEANVGGGIVIKDGLGLAYWGFPGTIFSHPRYTIEPLGPRGSRYLENGRGPY